jgi:Protein of unknown function (DUF1549)/Protein of unknown function (DUF1553)
MFSALLVLLLSPEPVAAGIDARLESFWQAEGIKPAALADEATLLRRLTLDLAGRIPTPGETQAFLADPSPGKRTRAVHRLMAGPEYALHLGRVLDEIIQGRLAGDPDFLEYLRSAIAEHRPWDGIFRDILLGPWDTKERKRAERFLARRVNNLDDLTNDTTRVFFGVDVSCARCHDHPLVQDWKQDHYFGMAAFFNPTYEGSKGKRGAAVQEKQTAPVSFVTTKGQRRTAKAMFLSGRVIEDPADKSASVSRREQLVRVALEEKSFFSRAIVNRLWAYFLGRGLVQPLDQMHSANPPVVPDLLEWLADDFAAHGYDLDRLVAALVSSRDYRLASTRAEQGEANDGPFARAGLRPLTPAQLALSMALAAGDGTYDQLAEPAAREKRYRELEGQVAGLAKSGLLDARTDRFQSSTVEALFLSNAPEIQRLVQPNGKNLVARLAATPDTGKLVETAVWAVLSRAPEADERAYLAKWIDGHQERARACSELVWALLTSAEFRFNH